MAQKFITRNGRKFKVTVPDEPKKTNVQKADEALKAASKKGAFTLPKQQEVKGISEPERIETGVKSEPRDFATEIDTAQRTTAGTLIESDDDPNRVAAGDIQFDLFGERTVPTSLEDQVNKLKEEQAEELNRTKVEIEEANKLEDQQFAELRESTESQIAGTTSAFAQGREGLIGSSTARVAKEFSVKANQRLDQAQEQVKAAQRRRDQMLKDLQKAQREGREAVALGIQERLMQANEAAAQAEQALLNTQLEVENQAAELRQQAIKTFDSLPFGSLENMEASDVSAFFGIDLGTASTLKTLDAQRAALREDDPDFQLKKANLRRAEHELKTAGMTTAQKEFLFAQSLGPSEREQFLTFAQKNPNFQHFKVNDAVYSFDPKTGATELVVEGASSTPHSIEPTGELSTADIGTRKVTLDSAAMVTFKNAYAQLQQTVGDVPFQAQDTFSHRHLDQQKKIYGQGRNVSELLADGFTQEEAERFSQPDKPVVTWTLQSKHLEGLALDFWFDGKDADYINEVERIMNANGWTRPIPGIDPGHFEFTGVEGPLLTGTEELQIANMSTTIFGKRAGTRPENLAIVRRAFLENDRDIDAAEDSLRLGGLGSVFQESVEKSAFDTIDANAKWSAASRTQFQETLEDKMEQFGADSPQVKEQLLALANNSMDAQEKTRMFGRVELLNNLIVLKNAFDSYIANGGDTNILIGTEQKIREQLGEVGDPELASLGNQIAVAIQDYRKAISGAAFTEAEAKEYEKIFPSAGKVPELNQAKISSLGQVIERNTNKRYETVMGQSNFSEVFPGGIVPVLLDLPSETILAPAREVDVQELNDANVGLKFQYDSIDNAAVIAGL